MLSYISGVFLVSIFLVSALYSFADTEIVHILPDKVEKKESPNKTLLQRFNDNYGRLYYFAQELTNHMDYDQKPQSFDFVNPHVIEGVPEFSSSIMPGVFLLQNVEKRMRNYRSIQDIKTFPDYQLY